MIMELAVATGWAPDVIRGLTLTEHTELLRALERRRS
jgi:hypothetical protein